MAPVNHEVVNALERFGREFVVPARDGGIRKFDGGVACANTPDSPEAAPEARRIDADYAVVAALPEPVKASIRRLLVLSVNASFYYLLEQLSNESRNRNVRLVLDGVDLYNASDEVYWPGLEGGLFSDQGWLARFSRYGEYGNTAVP
jgi:hypothetical protein